MHGEASSVQSGHTHNVRSSAPLLQRIRSRIVFVPFYVRPIMDDFETQGALYKRKDFLDKEEGAKNHPNRTYYFRKNVDVEKLLNLVHVN